MTRPPPRPTRPTTRFPYTTLFRSTSRGLVWLGGVTLALAGLFLAKYTYDHGWLALGPGARCAAGFLFGMTLAAAGEWLRRRPLQRAIAAIGPRSAEHTSELQSLMRLSYSVFCLTQKKPTHTT